MIEAGNSPGAFLTGNINIVLNIKEKGESDYGNRYFWRRPLG
jgi:hypothetical protein